MKNTIPTKKTSTRFNLPWLNPELKRMCRKKRRLYKKAKRSPEGWSKFLHHQECTRSAIREAHWSYINNVLQEDLVGGQQKSFWRYIKAQKQDSVGVAPLRKGNRLFSDSKAKAELLSDQFKSVFNVGTPDTQNVQLFGPNFPTIEELCIEEKGVQKLLQELNPSKAGGPDEIPSRFLKYLASELAPSITQLFRQSIDGGVLPEVWKQAWITPVYKKGNRNDPANYRPVSLTCILCKMLEHILCTHIRRHLDNHGILTPDNHGFRSRHSCETQLIATTHDILRLRDVGKQVDVAILDFSKAFDTVPHGRLLNKLKFYGIQGKTLEWIRAFLTARRQSVLVDGDKSQNEQVLSGVPQGTVLGPLLFLLHINEMPSVVNPLTKCRLFADDCLLYRVIDSLDDHTQLQQDLISLESWADIWGMRFNADKCHIMSIKKGQSKPYLYQLCNKILSSVTKEKYLGVMLSQEMSWSAHISSITTKAHQKLGFLRRNLKGSPQECKKLAYTALLRPALEYACTVWDPHLKKDINLLETVQRKAARWVTSAYENQTSVTALLKDLQLETLEERRRQLRLLFMYKIVHGVVALSPESLDLTLSSQPSRQNKNKFKLFRPRAHTTELQNSFLHKTIQEWNELPDSIAQADTVSSFKCRLSSLP